MNGVGMNDGIFATLRRSGEQVCRKIGIRRWPFQALKPVERKMQLLQEKVDASRALGMPTPAAVAEDLEVLQQRWNEIMASGAEVDRSDSEVEQVAPESA